jgi:hypothetical protein
MTDKPLIPPQQRHDAPDRNRPYTVLSPLVPLALVITTMAVVLVYVTFNALAVLSVFSGLVAAVANTPRLLRAPSLTRLERRLMVAAQRRRIRQQHRWERIDRALVRLMDGVELVGAVGTVVLLVTPVVYLASGPVEAVARVGLGILALALAASVVLTLVIVGYAQSKGDVATGPMHFYKSAALAEWMESHPDRTDDIQLWSLLMAGGFTMAAFVVEVAS